MARGGVFPARLFRFHARRQTAPGATLVKLFGRPVEEGRNFVDVTNRKSSAVITRHLVEPHLGHDPGELMTWHMREHDFVMSRPGMPVTAAHPRGHDAHHHAASRDRGIGHFSNRRLGLDSVNEYGAHRSILSDGMT